jgi:hypothetical protein
VTKARKPVHEYFKQPARARWRCDACGLVLAAIPKRVSEIPGSRENVFLYSGSPIELDDGERTGVVRIDLPLAEWFMGGVNVFCPRDGYGELLFDDVRSVASTVAYGPSKLIEHTITPYNKHSG